MQHGKSRSYKGAHAEFRRNFLIGLPSQFGCPWAKVGEKNWKNFCAPTTFGLKFSVCAPVTSALVGVSWWNFSRRRTARLVHVWLLLYNVFLVLVLVQLLEGRPPKFWEGKNSKFRRDFWQLSTLIANRIDMSKIGKKTRSITSSFTLGEKIGEKMGERIEKNKNKKIDCENFA